MALFRRKRRPSPTARPAASQPWLDHGLSNGDTVTCGRCDRELTVRLQREASVVVTHDGVLDQLTLICIGCGRLLCADCAVSASDNPYIPKCDRCRGRVVPAMSR